MTLKPFGSYELLKRFSIGATSELWFALPKQRRGDNRPLALKRLLPHLSEELEAVELFLREAKLGANLQHPNIVRIREFGEAEGSHYIARDFHTGQDLKSLQRKALSKPSVLTPHRALRIIASVCEALAYAYHRVDHRDRPVKLIHGDLTAEHILIGNDGTVKVIGFRGGKRPIPKIFLLGAHLPPWAENMAPEQLLDKPLDHRTDIFTAGLVLYELLTGKSALQRKSELETMQSLAAREIPPPSQIAAVPEALDALVMKALSKEPDGRYQDPRDFLRAIEEYLTAEWARPGQEDLQAMMYRLSSTAGGA